MIVPGNLPDGSGIDAVGEVKQKCPACRVLLCTAYVLDEAVVDALRSGADGFVEKTNTWDDFVDAVERVSRGERHFSTHAVGDTPATARALRHRLIRTKKSPRSS
ncbi:MAG: response regulator [Verrucomicrobiota bacterium]|nr:response regulator [Verrucomicrobiota bacterium]